jgi:peroxiredoxin
LTLALFAAACAPATPPARPNLPAAARPLPSVELLTLDGAPVRLEAALAGSVAVVSLWATWCEACATEFDALARLADRAGRRGAKVVAVAVGEPRKTVAEFVKWRGLPYAQLVDEKFALPDALGEKRVPTTLVIDRKGRVVYTGGALDAPALSALNAALN